MSEALWKVVEEETQPHWLAIVDPEGYWKAAVKWDGCIHLDSFSNEPFGGGKDENCDYLHICDVDEMIERLQELRRMAVAHFGEEWPEL